MNNINIEIIDGRYVIKKYNPKYQVWINIYTDIDINNNNEDKLIELLKNELKSMVFH